MKIVLACPAPPRSRKGNRVTAERWARHLKDLGHRVRIKQAYRGTACDLLIALHARRSFPAVQSYRRRFPTGPLVVALTGTDLYRDLPRSRRAQQSLVWADRIVLLQREGLKELAPAWRRKARVIVQSAEPARAGSVPARDTFDVCLLGHLRGEKDPFRAALALRRLSADSKVRVLHLGQALSPAMAARAHACAARDPRYRWLGEVSARQARRILARSRLLLLTSRMEGGANVLSEALADGVPVLASRIAGSVGILGADYPGFYPVGDTRSLAELLRRAETDARFYARLKHWGLRLAPLVDPRRERRSWECLLTELTTLHEG